MLAGMTEFGTANTVVYKSVDIPYLGQVFD